MIDPAMLEKIVTAVPQAAWGQSVVLLALLYGLAKFIAPIRQQAIPPKGSTNGHADTLHGKLDRLDGKLDRLDTRFDRLEDRVEDIERARIERAVDVIKRGAEAELGRAREPFTVPADAPQRKEGD